MSGTSRESDKFMLRLPDGMREQIKASAAKSGRSMNAEIVHAIGFYFAFDDLDPSRNADLRKAIDDSPSENLPSEMTETLIRRTLHSLEHELRAMLEAAAQDK